MDERAATHRDPRQAERVVRHYAQLAPAYDQRWDQYTRGSLGRLAARLPLEGDERVLDLACGTGRLARLLRQSHPRLDVTGVDLSPDMLVVARAQLPEDERTRWLEGTLETVALADGSFDVTTCNNAFHLLPDQAGTLRRMAALVRPGGRVAIIDWCRDYPQIAALQLFARSGLGQRRRILKLGEIRGLLEAAGLEIVTAERFPATRFWGMMCLVARRPLAGA